MVLPPGRILKECKSVFKRLSSMVIKWIFRLLADIFLQITEILGGYKEEIEEIVSYIVIIRS